MTGSSRVSLSEELIIAVERVLRRRLAMDEPPASRSAQCHAPPSVAIAADDRAGLALALYRARRDRDAIFGEIGVGFGEPGWDILLDLYAAHHEQAEVSVSSACIASAAPPTTGLRHLAALEQSGLIERRYDPFDRRRCFVSLSDSGVATMDRWASRLAEPQPPIFVMR